MKLMWAAKHYKKIQAMETAGLEVKYIYVDKEFIIEAIIFCLKKWTLVNFFPSYIYTDLKNSNFQKE